MARAYPRWKEGLVFELPPPAPRTTVGSGTVVVAMLVAVGAGLLLVAAAFVISRRVEA